MLIIITNKSYFVRSKITFLNLYYIFYHYLLILLLVMKMDKNKYKQLVDKNTPKENYIKNALIAFFVGGSLGALSELLLRCYSIWFNLPRKESGVIVTLSLIAIASILTAMGIFDTLVTKVKAALIIPITGFANSIASPAIEFKTEGLVLGLGVKMFVIAGPVLVYGISASVICGIILQILSFFGIKPL